jgi:hypothetical protein
MVEKYKDENVARANMAKAGLEKELPEFPFAYFRDEIVLRRSRKMAERAAQLLASGECSGGLFIAGDLHMQHGAGGGTRIYRNGGDTIIDVLRASGVSSWLMSTQFAPDGPRFAGATKRGAYALVTPENFGQPWPKTWEDKAAIILRQY